MNHADPNNVAASLRSLIAASEKIVDDADLLGQSLAAAHLSTAIDILRRNLQLAEDVS